MTKHITKDILRSITQDMNDALKAVGTKYGVDILVAGGTYADKNATLKTTISLVDENGEKHDKNRVDLDWAVKAKVVDERLVYGTLLVIPNKGVKSTWRVVGYNPRSDKLVLEKGEGQRYLFVADAIKQGLVKGTVTIPA